MLGLIAVSQPIVLDKFRGGTRRPIILFLNHNHLFLPTHINLQSGPYYLRKLKKIK